MNALIVIPVFDEAATIGRVVRAARAHGAVLVVLWGAPLTRAWSG